MLADEYILIVPFAYRLRHGATFLRNNNSNVLFFILFLVEWKTHKILSQGKRL